MKTAYAEDLKAFLQKKLEVQKEFFLLCRSYERMTKEQLELCGHRNGAGEAMLFSFRSAQKRIEKLEQEFLKQYPD